LKFCNEKVASFNKTEQKSEVNMSSIVSDQDFTSSDDKTLGWKCIEPVIQRIRGKDLEAKSAVYTSLTPGQQSLLIFWIIYGHTRNGIKQFYDELEYVIVNPDFWKEFKVKYDRFGDDNFLNLIKELENVYYNHIKPFDSTSICLNDTDFLKAIRLLDKKFNEIVPESFKKIGKFIRNNPEEFILFNV
jgi:hypothetical protein